MTATPVTKLIIQIPCLNEAQTLPATLRGPAAVASRASTSSRCWSSTTARATARRTWRAPAAWTTSCGCAATRGWRRRSRPASTPASRPAPTSSSTPTPTTSTPAHDIPTLLAPLLRGEADIVHRRPQHRRAAAHVVAQAAAAARWAAGWCGRSRTRRCPDTTSGFRAYTREAALRMTIVSEFSYTLESIIQAGKKRMAIAHVPVATNPRTRESRLFDSVFSYIKRSARDDRPHLRDVRAAEGVHVHRADHLRRRRRWRRLRFLYYYLTGAGAGHLSVADPVGGADDRRLPGAADRPARRRHLRQPQAARGSALPRALARAAAAPRRARRPRVRTARTPRDRARARWER